MLEINEINGSWDELDIPYFTDTCVNDWSAEGPLWDGLDSYLSEACMAVLE